MALIQIPTELLEPWYEKFEKLFFLPAIPRRCSGFGKVSILLSFREYGYCLVIPVSKDELYLFYIYVLPEFRRNGYGKSFMREIIELSQELNYKKIRLDVGYLNPKDRIPAPILRKFYKSLGFKKLKGTKMELDLNNTYNDLANSKIQLLS